MGFEIKDEASFKAWAEEADQKLAKVETIADVKATVDKLNTDMEAMKADFGRRQLPIDGEEKKRLPVTKEEFAAVGIKAVLNIRTKAVSNGDGTFSIESEDEDVAALHQAHDYLKLLCDTAVGGRYAKDPARFKFFREKYMPAREKVEARLKLAGLDTTELSAFDPTEYSRSLYEKLRLARLLPNLFARVDVPRFPFVLPTMPNDATAYKWTEPTTGGVGGTQITDGNTGSLSGQISLTGSSLAMQLAWSWELDEDSIVPMLPFLEAAVINAIGNGIETAILNGDTTSTHQDADVTGSTDARKLWKGLRYYALLSTAKNSAGGNKINTDALWRDNVGVVRGLMGKYGVNAGDLALICGPSGVNQIRSCESFRTLYAFGSQATNTSGGVSRPNGGFSPDGFDLVVSEFQREDIGASGVNEASGNTYTSSILVNKAMWLMAETRSIRTQVMNEIYAIYGQRGIVASWRGDFAPVFTPTASTNPHTGIVYGQGV